ncbi:MAG: hypothetical protein HC896_05140 [Bacteroidales bacterium]|nr:hypothetical protein [Bacteroidales bacterium]
MEAEVWSNPEVKKYLNENFIIAAFYTDDKTKLPENEWYTSKADDQVKKTLGKQNEDFQIEKFQTNSIPLYAIVDAAGKVISNGTYGYDPSIEKFMHFMKSLN